MIDAQKFKIFFSCSLFILISFQGLARAKFADDVIGALFKELKYLAANNK